MHLVVKQCMSKSSLRNQHPSRCFVDPPNLMHLVVKQRMSKYASLRNQHLSRCFVDKLDASCYQTMHVKVRKFMQPAPVSVFCGSSCVLLSNNACQSTQVYATSTSLGVLWIQMGLCPLSRHSHTAHLHAPPYSENSNMRDLSLRWSAIDTR